MKDAIIEKLIDKDDYDGKILYEIMDKFNGNDGDLFLMANFRNNDIYFKNNLIYFRSKRIEILEKYFERFFIFMYNKYDDITFQKIFISISEYFEYEELPECNILGEKLNSDKIIDISIEYKNVGGDPDILNGTRIKSSKNQSKILVQFGTTYYMPKYFEVKSETLKQIFHKIKELSKEEYMSYINKKNNN